MFKWFKPKNSVIQFRCFEEDWEVIPKPYPSRKLLPEWFKSLPPKVTKGFESSTIKRCAPFLDSMTAGWIIPLAADIYIKTNDDCSEFNWECKYEKSIIETHASWQISGDNHPSFPKPATKFMNYWSIKVPDDWSILFVPPLNRQDPRFTCMSGLVDCDKYEEFINFPFFWNKPNFEGILPAGTPLVQAIPIHRKSFEMKDDHHAFTDKELEVLTKTRAKRKTKESLYRDELWVRK
jgi:hypothetical protein